jgi:GH15 family glucan-1,4-alpha-glucosidase
VKHCNVPPRHQREVIRSALALKLHCFEDTGAIVAATTTSLPESPGSGRCWDYRYCWLRDSYYVLDALRVLGHFEERERFVNYLFDLVAGRPDLDLAPLYRVDGKDDLGECVLETWPGYMGEGPVRVGNGAALHHQHDVFGELVLALAPVFLDERFRAEATPETLGLLRRLARKAASVAGTPDAGIWELRTEWQPQTFSGMMCWAAADRMARVAAVHAPDEVDEFRRSAEALRAQVVERAWSEERGSFVSTYGGQDLDAALLQMAPLRMLPPNHPKLCATIDAIQRELAHEGWLYRYRADDGFGRPSVAFILCTFWLVEALSTCGRAAEAEAVLERAIAVQSPLGLLSEDVDPRTGRLWGNFPQAYSHVGLIRAAFTASPPWREIL